MPSKYADSLKSTHLSADDEREIINQTADKYKLTGPSRKLLHTIRHVENGKQGREFGVLNSHAERYSKDPDPTKSFKLQAEWAASIIKKHFKGDLKSFANHYAPTQGATNDVHGMNKNWLKNAQSLMSGSMTDDGYGS
jgi:hypothetical protein